MVIGGFCILYHKNNSSFIFSRLATKLSNYCSVRYDLKFFSNLVHFGHFAVFSFRNPLNVPFCVRHVAFPLGHVMLFLSLTPSLYLYLPLRLEWIEFLSLLVHSL